MYKTSNSPWNYPDVAFVRYCEKSPFINRGIYNTIDTMFYEAGFLSVVERRKQILSFIRCMQHDGSGFGRKGLRLEVNNFLANQRKDDGDDK
jgi:riboflavin kinase